MKRAEAQKAIDEAFAHGLKGLFGMLERNIVDQGETLAVAEFERGIAKYDQAHSAATSIVEKVFKE